MKKVDVNCVVTAQVTTRVCGQDQEGGEPVRSAPGTMAHEDGACEKMHLHWTCQGSRYDSKQENGSRPQEMRLLSPGSKESRGTKIDANSSSC